MNENIISDWYEAYRLIAKLLISKYGNRDNPAKDLYNDLKYSKFAHLNRGRLFRDSLTRTDEWGLDPIQIYATFNYTKIDPNRRIELINSLLFELGSEKSVNYISFEGIPSPIITQIAQYRGFNQQNEIWSVFRELANDGMRNLKALHFQKIKRWRGIDIASFTMFLFWINSEEFLPVDRNTVNFLKSISVIDHIPKRYGVYIDLCKEIKDSVYSNDLKKTVYRDLVIDSYKVFNFEQDSYNLTENTVTILDKYTPSHIEKFVTVEQIRKERLNGFKIIALRPLSNDSFKKQKHLKNLKEGELYQFYNLYTIQDDDAIILYNKTNDLDLYSVNENLNISISAIVGMNGSGKSTIADILYLIINKIAFHKKLNPEQKLIHEEVFVDLFVHLDTIYKISVSQSIEIFRYKLLQNNTYQIDKEAINIADFDLENLFYTISVNYSLYALNSNITGKWVNPLFWKNDGYQIPLVLNPMRIEGNIDVNREEYLGTSRLLANILEPHHIDFNRKIIPELVPRSTPNSIILTLDNSKIIKKEKEYKDKYGKIDRKLFNKIIKYLVLKIDPQCSVQKEAKNYIFFKVINISEKYYKKKYKDLPSWGLTDNKKLTEYLDRLVNGNSHIENKLKQAINILIYHIYDLEISLPLLNVISNIDNVKEKFSLKTIELIPPSFLNVKINFDHGGKITELSSGEKQQILSINTIIYHIYNIDSVLQEEGTLKYGNVNIIFDEIELYFHPEMQRTYIKNLLYQIRKMQLEYVNNINILFITHSPFILSDIPSNNILRLESGKPFKTKNSEETFGANIHDLLANDFFLEKGYMGEFVNNKIKQVIDTLNKWKKDDNKTKINEKGEIYQFIQIIGEPLIKDSLLDLYHEKIGLHESEFSLSEIDEEIKRLKKLKERITK
ncbi:AAA family ATPase [Sphingobacterium lactis]|uniref:AAA ATPase domain-containing protein n=1 Tax=Sphingobacterium lactis TaxID=797291 RepID=A0A1H5UEY8_9SPHI|nr:AAA family ATPase [Sphingobacterium lactis]SEF73594.1 AAA ATPase domain-containing protein [Sphingobacterium lactis]